MAECHNSCSKCLPYSVHMRKTSTPLVNCIVNYHYGLVSAMPNMQKTLLQFSAILLFTKRI